MRSDNLRPLWRLYPQGADTKYKILVGRSRDLAGPYLDGHGVPLLEEGGTVLIEREGSLIGTGYADVYSAAGYDYLVHHAYDADLDYQSVLNVRRLDWDDDGWPVACVAGKASASDQPSACIGAAQPLAHSRTARRRT